VAVWVSGIARWCRSTKIFYTPGPVTAGMGDRLRAGKPLRYVTSHHLAIRP